MNILEFLLALFICIPLIALVIFSQHLNKQRTKRFFEQLHRELDNYFAGLNHPTDDYTFYTNNHPYHWQKTNKESIIKTIENTITKSIEARKGLIKPARYSISKDENTKSIFIVAESNFNFKSIKTEQEYQQHLSNVAQNIALHKNS